MPFGGREIFRGRTVADDDSAQTTPPSNTTISKEVGSNETLTSESNSESTGRDNNTKTTPPSDTRSPSRRPLSNWFARMNQQSLDEEANIEDSNSVEKNETSSNTTATEWPRGRFWPASTSSRAEKASSTEDVAPKETIEAPQENDTKDNTSKDEPLSNKSESRSIQSPSMNLFRSFGRLIRPEQQIAEDGQEDMPAKDVTNDTIDTPEPDNQELESSSISEEKDSVEAVVSAGGLPLVSKLQEAASNAASFFRQLPWKPQGPSSVEVGDVKSDCKTVEVAKEEDSTTSKSLAEANANGGVESPASPIVEADSSTGDRRVESATSKANETSFLTSMKESVANTTAFLRRKVHERNERSRNTTRAPVNPSNPISIIRNLPWTPEGGKRFNVSTGLEPVKVNPIQFVLRLPWTPQRKSVALEERNETNEESSITIAEQDQTTIPLDDTEEKERISKADENTEPAPGATNDEVSSESESATKEAGKSMHLTLTEVPAVAEEEGDVMAMEVDDALSKYLTRQEGESASAGDDGNEDETDDWYESDDESDGDEVMATLAENDSHTTSNEKEDPSGSGEAAPLTLDSLMQRIFGSMEDQQASIEAKLFRKDSPSSNTTSTSRNVTSSDDSPLEKDDVVSNQTSVPPQGDRLPNQPQQPPIMPQQQQPTIIIMGGSGGGPGPQDGRMLPTELGRRPVPTPSLVLVEALVTLLGTAIRIWMISFLAKWWSEEDIMKPVQHFVWERLNDKYLRDAAALQNVLELPPSGTTDWKWKWYLRKQRRVEGKVSKRKALPPQTFARTVVVLDIGPEMNIPHLEQAITFILSQHREQAFGSINGLAKELEVIILVDSPGGAVTDYGLAGAQVRRLTQEPGVTTTVLIDKIAASGGYMIASQADRIFASTFAIVGSIGVIREDINVHDALERFGVKGLVLKAGDSKVPLTMLGKVTKSDVAKAQHTLDLMHEAFKEFVVQGRPVLEEDIEQVADGGVYFGNDALSRRLVDRIVTSEEYLLERIQAGDRVMKIHRAHQYVGRRKIFHPIDFLREKGAPLRASLSKWIRSDSESLVTRAVAATSVIGAVKYLAQYRGLGH